MHSFILYIRGYNMRKLNVCYSDSLKYSYYKDDVTVVIPVLNEEEAIGRVLENVKNEGYYNVLVVDGHSTDRTYHIANNNGVNVILQKGIGKTGAIETAIKYINTPYFVVLDGDCTYHPQDINNFFPEIFFNDQVIGSRITGRDNIPLLNRFGNTVINLIFNFFFKTNIVDVCSGMYALRTNFAKTLNFRTSGFDVEVEIAAQTARKGRISEVPVNYHPRVGTQKLRPIKDGLQIMFSIINLAIYTSAG